MRTNGCVVSASLCLSNGMHHRWAPMGECERLVERGDAKRVRVPGRKGMGPTRPVYKLVARPEPSQSQPNPAALRWKDSLLNVGIDPTPNHQGVCRREIARARERIREYQTVYQHDALYQAQV